MPSLLFPINTGESGFGQAQPGAAVAFDGTHCNFYSPNDTYAFYLTGSNYVLDVTSALGESLRFTVHIIDDGKIDIDFGTGSLTLERVN